MFLDVIDIRAFYASALGGIARRLVAQRIRAIWPDIKNMRLAGVGYATPYLGMFKDEALLCAAFMPARQGVSRWPGQGASLTTLVEPEGLPLRDGSIDRLLMVHGIEMAENLPAMLNEAWRVLAPGGHLLMVVPNRRGMWARFDRTPFGHGRPFSRGQLIQLLRDAYLAPELWKYALYMPPFNRSFLLRSAVAWERIGSWLWPGFGGVVLVEATKQVYAAGATQAAKKRKIIFQPGMKPIPANTRQRSFFK